MHKTMDRYLPESNQISRTLKAALLPLSLFVVLGVFWWLKLPGVTLAGEAFCGMPEHSHGDACQVALVCALEETEGHTHGEQCVQSTLTCTLAEAEGHAHGESCYTAVLSCTMEESETHTHEGEGCYTQALSCTQEEAAAHTHEAACYEDSQVCTLTETEGHSHGQDCYGAQSCELTEHIHVASCYSNLSADLETADDWEATLAGIDPALSGGDRLAAVAQSQLGYTESILNFKVDADGVRRGYTRYGQWYGNPYGDWSAMFVSFCLHYAGMEDAPLGSGAEMLRLQWEEAELYIPAADHSPKVGDVVFLDKNANASADAVAIVTAVAEDGISVVEGDLENRAAQTAYAVDDTAVMGYGTAQAEDAPQTLETETTEADTVIARAVDYDQSLFVEGNCFVVYTASGQRYYAFDGSGNAVEIFLDADGNITSDMEDPDTLLWTFTYSSTDSYVIKNVGTGRHMHAYPDNGTGVTTAGAYSSTLVPVNGGVRIQSNTEYAELNASAGVFEMTQTVSEAAVYSFGVTSQCALWFDGTNGGLMSLGGSPDEKMTTAEGETVTLPETWISPDKYAYRLQGWYDVKNAKYYAPGASYTVTGSTVFYADWTAQSYDIGKDNSLVADTVSTDSFITTRVFDYGPLFNVMSESAAVTVDSAGHSETWSLLTSGTAPYGTETLDFIFRDYDVYGSDISWPGGTNDRNNSASVLSGIYTAELGRLLFGTGNSYDPVTGEGVMGKQYLGKADHLFQIDHDTGSDSYGYYYYDSKRNAASFNQSAERFYVYDYLERTTDSAKDGGGGEFSDFLPFNSPYAQTNGKTVRTYTYDGESGEYSGVNHYMYDAKYNTGDTANTYVGTNYGFGMSVEIDFYLPVKPGTVHADGSYGNLDLYSQQMHFKFSGDDDVWVLLDGELVLDIGGIHGIESGDINFSTGVVMVNGEQVDTLSGVTAGDHLLTVYYLERGSSQSNCAMYFNLSPRFGLNLQKEDILTQEHLDGAEFSIFNDEACTVAAQLWTSEAACESGQASTNVFTVKNGIATVWGLSPGWTYYIKETKAPDNSQYSCASGIIRLTLDNRGVASYSVEVLDEPDRDASLGFSVYGFRIDEVTQQAYIVATNAWSTVEEVTSIQVFKKWDDDLDHSGDSITAYLTVTYPDGTTRRLRDVELSAENGWTHTWTGFPKYAPDGTTLITYGVEEAYVSGYRAAIEKVEQVTVQTKTWAEAYSFENGKTYLLTVPGDDEILCLSAVSESAQTLQWVDEQTAKSSPLALWTATVSGGSLRLTNGAGQILSFNYGNSSANRYFYVTTGSATYQTLVATQNGTGVRLSCTRSNRSYYMSSLGTNGRYSSTTSAASATSFAPMTQVVGQTTEAVEGHGFLITNRALEEQTALTVRKQWDVGALGTESLYEDLQVPVKLLADGEDTGRTVTLSAENGWEDTFSGLPVTDDSGSIIQYTVEEDWTVRDWTASYSPVTTQSDGSLLAVVTNTYTRGGGYELPATGTQAALLCAGLGGALMGTSLLLGMVTRRRRKTK